MWDFKKIFGSKENYKIEILEFEKQIEKQKDLLFGILLYFKGIEMMYSDQQGIIEINRESYISIRDRMKSSIKNAENLLNDAKYDYSKRKKIKKFRFPPSKGNPDLDQLLNRAKIILETYEDLFPNKPKVKKALRQHEIFDLLEKASQQF